MPETVSLKFEPASSPGRDGVLRCIASAVEELGQRECWPDSLVFKVNLALEELGLNILSYGGESGGAHPAIEIVIISDDEALTIEVSDDGRPFDPFQDAPAPAVASTLDDRPIGGLGIHLAQAVMDQMSYRHIEGKNRLTMVARRERPEGE